jgi:N-acetylmuramoyl-L-alanine amidase
MAEYKLNLDVALMLQKELEKLGAKVIMTRTGNNVKLSNVERAEIANKAKADLTVRIHADGSDNHKIQGISMLVPGSKYIKDKTVINKSKKAGKLILESVVATTSAKSRGVVDRDDLTGFNWSEVPVVLIEMGFMSNKEEDQKMNTVSYRQKLVSGMAKGIEKYFSAK